MEPSLLTGGTAPLSEAKVGTDPATRAWKGAPSGCTMRSAPAGRTRAHLARRRIAPLHSCARASSMCQWVREGAEHVSVSAGGHRWPSAVI